MTPQQKKARERRDVVVRTLEQNGPCMANYLLHRINIETKQGIDTHVLHRDLKVMAQNKEIKTETVIGLLQVDLQKRSQKMLVARLVKK